MTDYQTIYQSHAHNYDELVRAEDCDRALIQALATLLPLRGAKVLEVGAGTGRITCQLLTHGATVFATDSAQAMLDVAQKNVAALGLPPERCRLACIDARALEVPAHWADLAIAGWVFGHFRSWEAPSWRETIAKALAHMSRALRTEGTLVVVETLGTGTTQALPPTPALSEYYQWLEREQGFSRLELRTDYQFDSVAQAARCCGFFFGEEMAARIRREGWSRVPESTGLWYKKGA